MEITPSKTRSVYSLQITPAGLLFSIVVMMVAVLALSSGNNLLYLLVAVLVASGIFSLFAARLSLSRVDVTLRSPDLVGVGEPVIFDLAIENRRRLFPVFSQTLSLIEQPPGSRRMVVVDHAYLPILPRRTEARIRLERRFMRRGRHRFGAFRLETRFPFGFFDYRRRLAVRGELAVHPVSRPWTDYFDHVPQALGQEEGQQKGSGGDLYGIRLSLPTDHHHRIDWKATARTGQMMVREYARDEDWRATIILSLDATMSGEAGYEPAIELTASLAAWLLTAGAAVELITPATTIPSGSGEKQYQAILELLAGLPVSLETEDGHSGWARWTRWNLWTRWISNALVLDDLSASDLSGRVSNDWYRDRVARNSAGLVVLIAPTATGFPGYRHDPRIHFIAGDSIDSLWRVPSRMNPDEPEGGKDA
jgi:uncharacterized protein (DUF58 family)